MITAHDLQALLDLLRRTPMSGAESLYAQGLLARLEQLLPKPEEPAPPAETADAARPAPAEPTPIKAPPLRPGPLAGY